MAFGSPLGGVLFGLEGQNPRVELPFLQVTCVHFAELDTFANETDVMWRGFVASAIAAVSLQWVNPFGTSKLVLFAVIIFVHTFIPIRFDLARFAGHYY